jgi:DNA polymerase-3 subunit gamma/tau
MGISAEDEALFRIAKESTGSLRDAYTLFDQVVSFSAGNIRASLIREKLGLLGLESLNALAEACAANDTAAAFALIDRIIDGGVAIEQFVIDMAGYYRSLLLLKNGVTRESLLGYTPDRFSGKALEKLDSVHLERALDLLLDLYRNIRYSVSPRFELESAVSKLSWLNLWISPPELREEIARVRAVLGPGMARPGPDVSGEPGGGTGAGVSGPGDFGGGSSGPGDYGTAGTVKAGVKEAGGNRAAPPTGAGSEQEIFDSPLQFGKPGTFTEEFKRRMAARETAPKTEAAEGDEVTDIPPQAEMVRRVFHGTIVQKK